MTITHTSTTPNSPQLVVLNTQKYTAAVCNNGSAAAYILRPGVGAASTRWIISLQGGGECYDQPACWNPAATMPILVSTFRISPTTLPHLARAAPSARPSPPTLTFTMPLWFRCSTAPPTTAPGQSLYLCLQSFRPTTWNFQGHAIVKDVLADLNASHGLSSATEIMLTGQSAGGLGVFDNVNTIAPLIPSTVRFTAYSDAASET